jgi:hypothetical protein
VFFSRLPNFYLLGEDQKSWHEKGSAHLPMPPIYQNYFQRAQKLLLFLPSRPDRHFDVLFHLG